MEINHSCSCPYVLSLCEELFIGNVNEVSKILQRNPFENVYLRENLKLHHVIECFMPFHFEVGVFELSLFHAYLLMDIHNRETLNIVFKNLREYS